MIGDKAKTMLAEHRVKVTFNPRSLISKTQKIPQQGENPINNPDLFFTNGLYAIEYKPSGGPNVPKSCFFLLKSDLFPGNRHRVMSYRMINDFAEKGEWKFKFLRDWTTLTPEHFDLAINNRSTEIPFCFDVIRYTKMLKEKNDGSIRNIYTETEKDRLEEQRIEMIKNVKWELPVKIEV